MINNILMYIMLKVVVFVISYCIVRNMYVRVCELILYDCYICVIWFKYFVIFVGCVLKIYRIIK